MSLQQRIRTIGPGAMVAAAFIGPGTVVTATKAGGSLGFTLLWAVLFSTVSCLILQEMAARLGVVGGRGLGEAIRWKIERPVQRSLAIGMVLGAIFVGNAAYEAGNITGAAMGLEVLSPGAASMKVNPIVIVVGLVAFGLLLSGKYRVIESTLVSLVVVMGLVFASAALAVKPDWADVARGFVTPRVPDQGWMTVIGIIGTTVVPYNLFLHASSAKRRWQSDEGQGLAERLQSARLDSILSIGLGGVITSAILIAAAGAGGFSEAAIDSPSSLSKSLKGLLGSWAPIFLSVGFLAAGLSSAITTPLAAAFASTEVLGWKPSMSDFRFRVVWMVILVTGLVFACLGFRPGKLILFAQIANGLLLPIVAMFLVWIMNDRRIMNEHTNSAVSNLLGGLVILTTIAIGSRGIWSSGLIQSLLGLDGS